MTQALLDWAARAADRFQLGALESVDQISDPHPISRCHVLKLATYKGTFALKVYPKGWEKDRLLRAFAAASFFHRKEFPAPQPMVNKKGQLFESWNGESAICTSWLKGEPLWDPLKRTWAGAGSYPSHLREMSMALARFHLAMIDFKGETTPVRVFGSLRWFDQRLKDAEKLLLQRHETVAEAEEGRKQFATIAYLLQANEFPEEFRSQFILVDTHPGQFLFDGHTFSGIMDFDHVSIGAVIRDLSKFLATDSSTISMTPQLMEAYLSVAHIPEEQKEFLAAGMARCIITLAVNEIYRDLDQGKQWKKRFQQLREELNALREMLPDLKRVLELETCPGMPESF